MEEGRYKIRLFTLTIKEENGKYVLTKDQFRALLNHYRNLLALSNRLMEERQRLEFRLAEYRLKELGISETKSYLN
jgi:hypothetical protein